MVEPPARLVAFGNQLVQVHVALRERLGDLGEHLTASDLRDLRAHCLSFCAAVTRHHTAEDEGAFPVLAREHPELRSVLDELARDHRIVADALAALTRLVEEAGDDERARAALRAEVAGVAALLETHFTYEERKVAAALSGLTGKLGAADAELVGRATEVPR
ncbi:hemerythrin domain-containing protein [Saccharothrix sp. Mg75]|uniref:hemerythrin domain-containing protein n=1 Tax=Saccharothrix sp. Mg75 TaxID=3445357 RepID=UPI003EEBEDAF